MRVAILSDIHGYLEALNAVLEDIDGRGSLDHIVVAGDLCMFGPRPNEVLGRLREIPCEIIQGNTDAFMVDAGSLPSVDDKVRDFREWAKARLDDDDLSLLRDLSFSYEITPVRGHSLLVVHANPHDLVTPIFRDTEIGEVKRLTQNVTAEVLAFGHVHIPFLRRIGDLTLASVGSVGIPFDGDPRACYATLQWDGTHWSVSHHRVEYDLDATVEDMRTRQIPHAEDQIKVVREAARPKGSCQASGRAGRSARSG